MQRQFCFENLESRRLLAIITVNTLQDIVDPDDQWTSLREAVRTANTTFDMDEIRFHESLSGGTIELRRGEMEIASGSPVKIVGPGADLLTIDASTSDPTPDLNLGDGSRIFLNLEGEISGLTLTGGDVSWWPGGGAIVAGRLVVRDMIFRENHSADEAGAIRALGDLQVYDSWFDQNSAGDDGGAIYGVIPSIRVESSVFTHNFTYGWGGADGGAIAARSTLGEFVISNSTFSGNEIQGSGAGGAIDYGGSSAGVIVNSTIVNNSSSFAPGLSIREGEFQIRNTVIANNVGGIEGDLHLGVPEVTIDGVLIGNAAQLFVGDDPKVHFGRSENPLDPALSPLIDDGISFPYHMPEPGSPLIDGGVEAVDEGRDYDQRGMPHWRSVGAVDIGAVEFLGAGDRNGNEIADASDIDTLCTAIHEQSLDLSFDMDGNSAVELLDIEHLMSRWRTGPGDVNLDRQFDSADLVGVFSAAEYRDDLVGNSRWSTGDWDCDGDFDTSDLVVAFQAAWFEQGRRLAVVTRHSDVAAATHGLSDAIETDEAEDETKLRRLIR
ncbi:choice-of-anchor Q domain-containing protein [Planctomycetota bacterium]